MPQRDSEIAEATARWRGRDWVILVTLLLASCQCVLGYFFESHAGGVDWHRYAHGGEEMPYQGRVGMIPVLRWAESSRWMIRGAAEVQEQIDRGRMVHEPESVEKFASTVAGLLSMEILLGFSVWYGRRRRFHPWWLPSVLMLAIFTVTLAVKSERNNWTPYDLPHACLFGLAVMCAFEGWWLVMLLLFALDVPMRETSMFLLAISAPMSYAVWGKGSLGRVRCGILAAAMALYWLAWRFAIERRFAHNGSDTGQQIIPNLRDLVHPIHWPQMFSVGGYLILFLWLERRLLAPKERMLMYGTLLCMPVTLYFGLWSETRIWVEWTLPWAILGSLEWQQCLRPSAARGRAFV